MRGVGKSLAVRPAKERVLEPIEPPLVLLDPFRDVGDVAPHLSDRDLNPDVNAHARTENCQYAYYKLDLCRAHLLGVIAARAECR